MVVRKRNGALSFLPDTGETAAEIKWDGISNRNDEDEANDEMDSAQ